jgi:hypothetical protein
MVWMLSRQHRRPPAGRLYLGSSDPACGDSTHSQCGGAIDRGDLRIVAHSSGKRAHHLWFNTAPHPAADPRHGSPLRYRLRGLPHLRSHRRVLIRHISERGPKMPYRAPAAEVRMSLRWPSRSSTLTELNSWAFAAAAIAFGISARHALLFVSGQSGGCAPDRHGWRGGSQPCERPAITHP